MHNFKTEGIIVKRRNFNEADRIVTILTKEFGKLQVKATGVRRITSRRSSHVELLNLTALSLYKGQHMPVLIEAQMLENFQKIKDDLDKTGFAYHICELVDGLCPEGQEQGNVFELVKTTLTQLETTEDPLLIIHAFEISLLTQLGYWHRSQEESVSFDTHQFIESILERRLKSHRIFASLH
jgi:DNA repair protein RecO (recombination protein O)